MSSPTPDSLAQQVIAVLERVKGRPLANISAQSRLVEDLDFQSIDIVQLMIEIQAEFSIALTPEDYVFENFSMVSLIAELVGRYLHSKPHTTSVPHISVHG